MRSFAVALCAPSGTGKTTVARHLVQGRDDLLFSVSATTRSPRPGETDGVDYRFLSRAEFERWIEEDALLEWARVHDEYYGTPRANLQEAQEKSMLLVLDIDVQGARQVMQARPDSVTIFLLPPSAQTLMERIRKRGSEDAEQVRKRLETARSELEAVGEFDYVVVNEDLGETVETVAAIISAESRRLRRSESEIIAFRDSILKDLEGIEL